MILSQRYIFNLKDLIFFISQTQRREEKGLFVINKLQYHNHLHAYTNVNFLLAVYNNNNNQYNLSTYLSGFRRWAQSIIEPSYIRTLLNPACLNCKNLCEDLEPE